MNPYSAPGAAGAAAARDATPEDLAAYESDPTTLDPKLPRTAAASGFFAAAMAMLAGWQTLDSVRLRGAYVVFPYALLFLGGAALVSSVALFRARAWSALGAAASDGLLALVSTVWLLIAVSHGLFAFYSLFTPPSALLSAILSVGSINAVSRAARLRRHFDAQGLRLR